MPIEIAHYTLTYEEGGRREQYRVLRIIQPGDTGILFDAGDITGVSEPFRFWGERMKGNKLVSPAYFLRGTDSRPTVVGDLPTYLDAIGGQDAPMTVDTLIIVHQLFLTGISGAVLSMRYIPPTAPLHQWWETPPSSPVSTQ
jgi:hypothetical protein